MHNCCPDKSLLIFTFLLLAGFLFTQAVFTNPVLSGPTDFQAEGGVILDIYLSENLPEINFFPSFRFYMGKVIPGERPIEEAAFLDRLGYASACAQIFAGMKQANITNPGENMENTTVGFDSMIHWIWDVLPVSISIPFTDKRIRWKFDNDETAAVLRYHTFGVQAGYYVLPNTEVSIGLGYIQPDLFYKTNTDTTIYSYLAWDISLYTLEAKSVWPLSAKMWIALNPAVTIIRDQEDNVLTGVAMDIVFYPLPTLGIGVFYSSSSFNGGNNYWNDLIEAMGATQIEVSVSTALFSLAGVRFYASLTTPEDTSYSSVTIIGGEFFLRL